MLGITTPDAIAFGSLIIGLLAAWKGGHAGAETKKVEPPPPHPFSLGMATFADTAAMNALTDAIHSLCAQMQAGIKAEDERLESKMAKQLADALERLERIAQGKLDGRS